MEQRASAQKRAFKRRVACCENPTSSILLLSVLLNKKTPTRSSPGFFNSKTSLSFSSRSIPLTVVDFHNTYKSFFISRSDLWCGSKSQFFKSGFVLDPNSNRAQKWTMRTSKLVEKRSSVAGGVASIARWSTTTIAPCLRCRPWILHRRLLLLLSPLIKLPLSMLHN